MTHYRNGVKREYQARDALIVAGWEVIRSAGSKTPVDLVAFRDGRRYRADVSIGRPGDVVYHTPQRQVVFVQVKRTGGTIAPAERLELQRLALIAHALPVVAYQPAPRKPLAWRELTGPGPKDWRPWTPGGET